MRLLLVDDDRDMAEHVRESLEREGHSVEVAATGQAALASARSGSFDVLIVDRMLPELDGLALVQKLRAEAVATPVLFLTALAGIGQRVEGLNAGGDDYLVKPFAFEELAARVAALGRRPTSGAVATTLKVADLEMDLLARTVSRGGIRISLQPREFRLLEYLMRHQGRTVTRRMLLEQVWGFHFDPGTNIVETHVSRLRAKLDKDFGPALIETVRGAGYILRAPE